MCENRLFQDIFSLQNLILSKVYVIANIINIQIFDKIKIDLKGHFR
jgi:hypothetical protein